MQQATVFFHELWRGFLVVLSNNWSIIAGLLIAFTLVRFVKASVHIVVFILFVGVTFAICTNLGLLPPMHEIIREVLAFVGIQR